MNYKLSKVNFKNLIKDLADMYTYPIPEVVLVELIANSLDAGASLISVSYEPEKNILTVEDNGKGMNSVQFEQYHDLAAGLKSRGDGIGFAGLGAKISFNVASRVITETRSESFIGGSNWYLKSESELAWEKIDKPLLNHNGTRVSVHFNNRADVSYTTSESLRKVILTHYLPLFDETFIKLYQELDYYPKQIQFVVNGAKINPFRIEYLFKLDNVKKEVFADKKGKAFGFGIFGLSQQDNPFNGEQAGIAVSVRGKVVSIDFLNLFPGNGAQRIFGLAEVPPLIQSLNTSKESFIKRENYQKYIDPLKVKLKEWLHELGITTAEELKTKDAVKLERELKKMIEELPELFHLFGSSIKRNVLAHAKNGLVLAEAQEGINPTLPLHGDSKESDDLGLVDTGTEEGVALVANDDGSQRAKPISRSRRAGVHISFLEAPDNSALGWLDDDILIINIGHPSYLKVATNNARKMHNIFSIAVTLERELKQRELIKDDENYVERFMIAWGKT